MYKKWICNEISTQTIVWRKKWKKKHDVKNVKYFEDFFDRKIDRTMDTLANGSMPANGKDTSWVCIFKWFCLFYPFTFFFQSISWTFVWFHIITFSNEWNLMYYRKWNGIDDNEEWIKMESPNKKTLEINWNYLFVCVFVFFAQQIPTDAFTV